eukprot:gene27707-33490_t
MPRVGGGYPRPPIHWTQPLTLEASAHPLSAHELALLAELLRDTRSTITTSTVAVYGLHLDIQILVCQGPRAGRSHAPLAVSRAGHRQNPAQPADGVFVAMILDPGVLHRDPLAKYAVAFRRISTSSFASASSLRSRLFSASNSVTGRRSGCAVAVSGADPTSTGLRLRDQLLNVAEGIPSLRAASWPPTESDSLMASILNSSVYCRFEVTNFLLYVKSRQGHSGKGVGLVIPTLLSWTGSAVIHDIKGENWNLTAGWRTRFSHCLLFNPTDAKSAAYNPLLEVR